jgi:hypothetical protein
LPGLFLMMMVWVAPAVALQISPTTQSYEVKPGGKVQGEFTVTNSDNFEIMVFPEPRDWYTTEEHKKYKMSDWFVMKSTSVFLKPGDSQKVLFELQAPKGAKGEFMGMASMVIDDGSAGMLQQRLSAAVYLQIKGTEIIGARMVGLMIHPSTTSLQGGILIQNTGNVHVRPEGVFQIANAKNEPLYNFVIQRDRPTQAQQTREYTGDIPGIQLKPGHYIVNVTLTDIDHDDREIIKVSKKFEYTEDRKIKMDMSQ